VTEQISRKNLKEARKRVISADSRRIVARRISKKQPVSYVHLAMPGVKVKLEKVGYRLNPNPLNSYIIPIEKPKTKQRLLMEVTNILSNCSLRKRNITRIYYHRLQHNIRLLRRMGEYD